MNVHVVCNKWINLWTEKFVRKIDVLYALFGNLKLFTFCFLIQLIVIFKSIVKYELNIFNNFCIIFAKLIETEKRQIGMEYMTKK